MEYFTTTHIKKILSDLRIPYASNEVALDGLSFKSLRRIETRGIYYAEGKSNA